jgi:putative ABC transport system permease protein
MLKNYLRLHFAICNNKDAHFYQYFRLSIGMACFSLFLLYAVNEFSYDRFNVNAAKFIDWCNGQKDPNRKPGGEAWWHTSRACIEAGLS